MNIINRKSQHLITQLRIDNYQTFIADETSFYVALSMEFYRVHKYDKYGRLLWKTNLTEAKVDFVVQFQVYGTFIYVSANGILYLLDQNNGIILRRIALSDLAITSMVLYDDVMFLYTVDSRIFLISAKDATLLNIYEDEEVMFVYKKIMIANGYLFQSKPDSNSVVDQICYNNFLLVQRTLDTRRFFVSTNSYMNIRSSTKSYSREISYEEIPRTNVLNLVVYLRRWNNIQSRQQNALFNPVLIPNKNKGAYLIYFSGAGSCERNICENNLVKTINITSFDPIIFNQNTEFNFWQTSLFTIVPASNCCRNTYCVPEKGSMLLYSSLFDYASVLLQKEGLYYYVIHSGCPCYKSDVTRHVFLLQIQNYDCLYLKGDQTIDLKR
jgi:hypothetical protein